MNIYIYGNDYALPGLKDLLFIKGCMSVDEFYMLFILSFASTMLPVIILTSFIQLGKAKLAVFAIAACLVALLYGSLSLLFEIEMVLAVVNILMLFLLAFYEQRNLINSALTVSWVMALLLSTQSIIGNIYFLMFNATRADLMYNTIAYWTVVALTVAIAVSVSLTIGRFMRQFIASTVDEMKTKHERQMLIIFSLSSVLLFLFMQLFAFAMGAVTSIEVLRFINSLLFTIVFILACVLFYSFHRFVLLGFDLKVSRELSQYLESYSKTMENLNIEMRSFRHDAVDVVKSAYGYVENEDIDGLRQHFKNEIAPVINRVSVQTDIIRQIQNINNPSIQGLIMLKILTAIDSGINVNIGVERGVGLFGEVSQIDMVRVFSILLENVVEECSKIHDSVMHLAVYKSENSIIIYVKNQFSGIPPQIGQIFKMGYSTKGKDRGVGLSVLQKIIHKYKSAAIETYIQEDYFVQKVIINLQKSG